MHHNTRINPAVCILTTVHRPLLSPVLRWEETCRLHQTAKGSMAPPLRSCSLWGYKWKGQGRNNDPALCASFRPLIPRVGIIVIIILMAFTSTLPRTFCHFNGLFGGRREKQMRFISPLDLKVQLPFVNMVHAYHKQVRSTKTAKITSVPWPVQWMLF